MKKLNVLFAAVLSLAFFAGILGSCSISTSDDSALAAYYAEAAKREQEAKDWMALTNIGTSIRLVDNTWTEGHIREAKREWNDAKKENIKFTFKAVAENGYKFVYEDSNGRRVKVYITVNSERKELTDITHVGDEFSFVVPRGTTFVRVEGHDVFVASN